MEHFFVFHLKGSSQQEKSNYAGKSETGYSQFFVLTCIFHSYKTVMINTVSDAR